MRAVGRVLLWQGGSLWIGRGEGRTGWHGHHAHQITLPLRGTCRIRRRADEEWTDYAAAFVPSERPHQLEMDELDVAQLFVEPETAEGRALSRRFPGTDPVPVAESERAAVLAILADAWRGDAGDDALIAAGRAAVAALAGSATPPADLDPRIARSLGFIRERLRGPLSLAEVASAVALSAGRFRHLFVRETGVAFRPYVLWLRLNVAIACSMQGRSWTEAAHEAGFADSAHLSRTFRRMFGINPATLVRG